ncbi:MAG: helix-turn-helix transcriptional regulator [Clostridia bacterium]|nr:helix-turn-helix transcriptional regulator [Clostridia bacterium]
MLKIYVQHRDEYRVVPASVKRFVFEPGNSSVYFGAHNHDSLEILLVREGAMNVRLNDTVLTLNAGDAALVNPYDSHTGFSVSPDSGTAYDCLMLEPGDWALGFSHSSFNELLTQIRQGSMRFASFWASGNPHTVRLTAAIDRLRMLFDGEMDSDIPVLECELVGEVYRLLSLLASTAARTPQEYLHNRDLTFIRSVAGYVSEHFAAPISGADICSALGFSRRNFSRLFRRSFGTTFTDYLREYRIQRAASDFRGSALPIPEIAAAVGFTDYCYFSRSFKRVIGITPAQYFR